MSKIQLNMAAPDFVLNDLNEQPVQLSDFHDKKNVVLVFNRGLS